MSASSPSSKDRRGMGIAVALVVWVVAMALIFGLVANQSSGAALNAMARAAFTNTMVLAGESAIDEVAYRLRHLRRSASAGKPRFDDLAIAGVTPETFEPKVTRRIYSDPKVTGGLLTINPIVMSVWQKPADPQSTAPWLIDLSAEVKLSVGGSLLANFTRVVKRRYKSTLYQVFEVLGPQDNLGKLQNNNFQPADPRKPIGEVVYSELTMEVEPVLELVVGK